jgi:hypothetical protein
VLKRPWEIYSAKLIIISFMEVKGWIRTISTVGIDGLEEAENYPHVHRQDVEISGIPAVQQWSRQCPGSQNKGLYGVSILSRETEWCGVLMMQFVDMFI